MVSPALDNQTTPAAEPTVDSGLGYSSPSPTSSVLNPTQPSPQPVRDMSPGQAYQPQGQSQPQAQPQQQQQPQPAQSQQPLTPPNQGYTTSFRQQSQEQPLQPPASLQTDDSQENVPYDPYYDDYLPVGPQQEELIYEWKAPSRPFKQHNRQYYTTVGTIVLLIVLILFFAGQILPIAVVLAAAFLTYIMSSIPPHTILNQITTYGIRTADNLYYWDEMGRFWFKDKYQDKILHVEVARFPERLTILVGEAEEDLLREILSLALLEQEPAPTYYEKAAAWLQEKIPLDIDS